MELNIQQFGGRGASSFSNKNTNDTYYQIRKQVAYETMMKYVNTGRDSDFKDYVQLDDGTIIARDNRNTYSVIENNIFVVDGERIPADNKYMQTNSDSNLLKIDNRKFKKISRR